MSAFGPGRAAAVAAGLAVVTLTACRPTPPSEVPASPLPTRQTAIEPITKKLDAAQQEAERRRAEGDRTGQ
jgi:hypothetical protein